MDRRTEGREVTHLWRLLSTAALLAAPVLLAPAARAGEPRPSSLLLFCEYDSRPGTVTLATVTNTNTSEPVDVMWVYIEESTCLEFNRVEHLTPNDTLTVVTSVHNPVMDRGFLYVYAVDDSFEATAFDHLIGTSAVLDGFDVSGYGVDPMPFRALVEEGGLTDLDADGVRDLDGAEYEAMPDELLIPRFFGQAASGNPFTSELVLLNLSGGGQFTAVVDFLLTNDNEELFSVLHTFHCWTKRPLLDISQVFSEDFLRDLTFHDPGEVVGATDIESGWMWLDGAVAFSTAATIEDPAIAGFLIEHTNGRSAADLPYGEGLQTNGGLLPTGALPAGTPSQPERGSRTRRP